MRGRGGQRGGRGIFSAGSSLMGGFTHADISSMAKQTALYPDLEVPVTDDPLRSETRISKNYAEFQASVKRSSDYLSTIDDEDTTFPDAPTAKRKKTLALKSPLEMAQLDPRFFPKGLWQPFFEKKPVASKTTTKHRRNDDAQSRQAKVDEAVSRVGEEDAAKIQPDGEEAEEVEAELEEPSEEEDLDYEQNYFDNGEDDDDGNEREDQEGGVFE